MKNHEGTQRNTEEDGGRWRNMLIVVWRRSEDALTPRCGSGTLFGVQTFHAEQSKKAAWSRRTEGGTGRVLHTVDIQTDGDLLRTLWFSLKQTTRGCRHTEPRCLLKNVKLNQIQKNVFSLTATERHRPQSSSTVHYLHTVTQQQTPDRTSVSQSEDRRLL